ncbi:glutathione S-transferase-like [Lytechinus variegatus]|uniref:glutathione S-transferase-like n=1 Tax=Lytechinus variegatus TaxID=7654 RepID=UPI001BB19E35|nr:glutathione S-transferase-like [Lytechinus variegatus]
MPSYKLIYFNVRGRAETARMLLALGGCEFVDERFEVAEWPQRKPDTATFPIGQAPVLMVDDRVIPQSKAINRYLARKFDLYGANDFERTEIDIVLETMNDLELKVTLIYAHHPPEDEMARLKKEFAEKTSKPYVSYLDQLIKKAGGKYFVGNKISLADIHVFTMLEMFTDSARGIEGVLDDYPDLRAFYKYFKEEGPLKSYIASRPAADY